MKDYKEVAESVFQMRDRYLADKKRKRALVIKSASALMSCFIVIFVGMNIWKSELLRSIIPGRENDQSNIISEEDISETTENIIDTTDISGELIVTTAVSDTGGRPIVTTVSTAVSAESDTSSVQTTFTDASGNVSIVTTAAEEETGAVYPERPTTTAVGGAHEGVRTTTTMAAGPVLPSRSTTSARTTASSGTAYYHGTTTTTVRYSHNTTTTTAKHYYTTTTTAKHYATTTTAKHYYTTATTAMYHYTTTTGVMFYTTTTTGSPPSWPPDYSSLTTTTGVYFTTSTMTNLSGTTTTTQIKYDNLTDYYSYYPNDNTAEPEDVDRKIGDNEASGYDEVSDSVVSGTVELYKAKDISEDYALLVKYPDYDDFYYFINHEYLPDTVGDLIDDTNLRRSGAMEWIYSQSSGDMKFGNSIEEFVDMLEQYRELPVVLIEQEPVYGVDYSVYGSVYVKVLGSDVFEFRFKKDGYIQFKNDYFVSEDGNNANPSIYIGPEAVKAFLDNMYEITEG